MQVKTYCAGRVNGDVEAFEKLDKMVEEDLGHGPTIHSVIDTEYGTDTSNPNNFIIARVIVFSYQRATVG